MSPVYWYAGVGMGLFGIGFLALILHGELLRRVIALNIMGSGVFLFFVAMANRADSAPDPVPLAMVLTGLVVSVSASALALALIVRLKHKADGAKSAEDFDS